jgi:hypothetical protein
MDRLKALVREPALLIDAFESLVVVCIALGLFNLTGDQQTNTVALFIAILAFAKGFLTHPFPVTVVPDLGRAALVFCVSLGLLKWSPDQVTVVVTFLGTAMTLVQRSQITPRYDSIARPGGAGAGPVANTADQAGYITPEASAGGLVAFGLVLAVLGLISSTGLGLLIGAAMLFVGVGILLAKYIDLSAPARNEGGYVVADRLWVVLLVVGILFLLIGYLIPLGILVTLGWILIVVALVLLVVAAVT